MDTTHPVRRRGGGAGRRTPVATPAAAADQGAKTKTNDENAIDRDQRQLIIVEDADYFFDAMGW